MNFGNSAHFYLLANLSLQLTLSSAKQTTSKLCSAVLWTDWNTESVTCFIKKGVPRARGHRRTSVCQPPACTASTSLLDYILDTSHWRNHACSSKGGCGARGGGGAAGNMSNCDTPLSPDHCPVRFIVVVVVTRMTHVTHSRSPLGRWRMHEEVDCWTMCRPGFAWPRIWDTGNCLLASISATFLNNTNVFVVS